MHRANIIRCSRLRAVVGRYGAFTYGRIGTHDKSMFGLPLCQMPGERKVKRAGEREKMKESEKHG
jgi:hypothetical protein